MNVSFYAKVQKSARRLTFPAQHRHSMEINNGDSVYMIIKPTAESSTVLFDGRAELKSGPEIYGRKISKALRPGSTIFIQASKPQRKRSKRKHEPEDTPHSKKESISKLKLKNLPVGRQLEYEVRTRDQVKRAKKREQKLVEAYSRWLKAKKRSLDVGSYARLQCDAYEELRNNLIEAKSSTKREYIRMAVGQLLDYSYLGSARFGRPNLAILLPKKPDKKIMAWLKKMKISVIWEHQKAFRDNANGKFT